MHDEPLSMHNPEQQEKTQAQTARNPTTNSKRNNQLSKQELTTTIIMLDLVAPRLRTSYADDTEPLRPIWVVVKIMVPFWGTLNNRCRIILGTQKGTIILTTTYIHACMHACMYTRTHTYTHTHTHAHTCILQTFTYMYIYLPVHIHAYAFRQTHR